ncbi:uncharacterized protein LOC135110369 [Scylla paramamosain]|uniref:uncharacterized protein LOC135110369 n=1 Tax=Scylla paramamosain TaxID=85552 RepID=UPI003082AB72
MKLFGKLWGAERGRTVSHFLYITLSLALTPSLPPALSFIPDMSARRLVTWVVMVMVMVMVVTAEAKTLEEWMEVPAVDGDDGKGERWSRGSGKERNDNDNEVTGSDDDSGTSYSDKYDEMTYRNTGREHDSEMSYSDKEKENDSETYNADTDDNSDMNSNENELDGSGEVHQEEEDEEDKKEKKRLTITFINTTHSPTNTTDSHQPRLLGHLHYLLKPIIDVFLYTFTNTHEPPSEPLEPPETPLPLLPLPRNLPSQSLSTPIPRSGTPTPSPPLLNLSPSSQTAPTTSGQFKPYCKVCIRATSHAKPQLPPLLLFLMGRLNKTTQTDRRRKEAGRVHRKKENVKQTDKDDHKLKQKRRILINHRSSSPAPFQRQNKDFPVPLPAMKREKELRKENIKRRHKRSIQYKDSKEEDETEDGARKNGKRRGKHNKHTEKEYIKKEGPESYSEESRHERQREAAPRNKAKSRPKYSSAEMTTGRFKPKEVKPKDANFQKHKENDEVEEFSSQRDAFKKHLNHPHKETGKLSHTWKKKRRGTTDDGKANRLTKQEEDMLAAVNEIYNPPLLKYVDVDGMLAEDNDSTMKKDGDEKGGSYATSSDKEGEEEGKKADIDAAAADEREDKNIDENYEYDYEYYDSDITGTTQEKVMREETKQDQEGNVQDDEKDEDEKYNHQSASVDEGKVDKEKKDGSHKYKYENEDAEMSEEQDYENGHADGDVSYEEEVKGESEVKADEAVAVDTDADVNEGREDEENGKLHYYQHYYEDRKRNDKVNDVPTDPGVTEDEAGAAEAAAYSRQTYERTPMLVTRAWQSNPTFPPPSIISNALEIPGGAVPEANQYLGPPVSPQVDPLTARTVESILAGLKPGMVPSLGPGMGPGMGPQIKPDMLSGILPGMGSGIGPQIKPGMMPDTVPGMGQGIVSGMKTRTVPNYVPGMGLGTGPNIRTGIEPSINSQTQLAMLQGMGPGTVPYMGASMGYVPQGIGLGMSQLGIGMGLGMGPGVGQGWQGWRQQWAVPVGWAGAGRRASWPRSSRDWWPRMVSVKGQDRRRRGG